MPTHRLKLIWRRVQLRRNRLFLQPSEKEGHCGLTDWFHLAGVLSELD